MMSSGGYTSIDNQKVSGSVPAVSGSDHVSVRFSDSNLQTFPPSGPQGKISGTFRPPPDADDTSDLPFWCLIMDLIRSRSRLRGARTGSNPLGGCIPSPSLLTGRTLTATLRMSWKGSKTPCCLSRGALLRRLHNPDLYGPFWICTTLIFVAAAVGTFVTYLAHKLQKKEWDYDINLVTWSVGLFYGYATLVPLCLYVILKYFSAPSSLVQLLCLYGYSLFVFIPASCLSIVPVEIFRWIIAGVAGLISAAFVALNLRTHIVSAGERWFLIVVGIFLLQLALSVVLKLYFFTITVATE